MRQNSSVEFLFKLVGAHSQLGLTLVMIMITKIITIITMIDNKGL